MKHIMKKRQGSIALILVIIITVLTLVSAVVVARINIFETIANYILMEEELVEVDIDSCLDDALWRISSTTDTVGSFNISTANVDCSYKISATALGLKTVTTTASSTGNLGDWYKTIVVQVNVSTTPISIWSYKDGTFSDTVLSQGAQCGDWNCDGSEDCETCSLDCGSCFCGDSDCTTGEDANNCADDSGGDCPAVCPDTYCTHSETECTCAADCADSCGDGCCTGSETCGSDDVAPSCNSDCGSCQTCGNGVVEGDEVCDYTGWEFCDGYYTDAVGCGRGTWYCNLTCDNCAPMCS